MIEPGMLMPRLVFGDPSGHRTDGNVRFVVDGREAADGEFTHVMVRLKTTESDIVDTLIAAGIATIARRPPLWGTIGAGKAPSTREPTA
jgi:hypothetical protein